MKFFEGLRGFKSDLRFTAREYVGGLDGAVDNFGVASVAPLPRATQERRYQRTIVTADGLSLHVHYGLTHGILP